MLVACPTCKTRYRVDETKIGETVEALLGIYEEIASEHPYMWMPPRELLQYIINKRKRDAENGVTIDEYPIVIF